MALHEFTLPSANGRDAIRAWVYDPVVTPRGIVQIVHGLGEHSRRYLRLITVLLDAGFVVAADDHAGHGATAAAEDTWGDAGAEADRVVVEDELALLAHVRSLHPGLPAVVYGHSWGSMISRVVAARAEPPLAGLVLGGIAADMHGMEQLVDRAALAAEPDPEAEVPGHHMAAVFDGFVDRFGPDAGPTDWVAADPDVVADHARDPLNRFGAPLSVRFLQGFVALYDQANDADWYAQVPADLPVLILVGDQDPVAGYGSGAYTVGNRLIASGHEDVRVRVYPGFRHEVHNEPPIRDEVAAEIIGFAGRACSPDA